MTCSFQHARPFSTTPSFDRSVLPLPRIFYEAECGKLSGPSRGWVRSRCPLHGGDNPTSFAVNLDSGGFFCHSCGAKGGDIVAFVRLRYGLDFASACKRLGAWKGDRGISASSLRNLKQRRERQNQVVATIAAKLRELRLGYRDEIHLLELAQRRISESLSDGVTPEEVESCCSELAAILPQLREAVAGYYFLSFAGVGERIRFLLHPESRAASIQALINRGTVRDDAGNEMEVDFSIAQGGDGRGHGVEVRFP